MDSPLTRGALLGAAASWEASHQKRAAFKTIVFGASDIYLNYACCTLECKCSIVVAQDNYMPQPAHTNVVALLPETRPPWKEFLLSMTTQSLLVVAGLALLAVLPRTVTPSPERSAVHLIETPYPTPRVPQPTHTIHPLPH